MTTSQNQDDTPAGQNPQAEEPEIGEGQYEVGDEDQAALTTDPEAQQEDSVINPSSS